MPLIDRCIPWRPPWYLWLAAAVAVLAGIQVRDPHLLHGQTLFVVVPGIVLVLLVAAIMWELPPAAMVCAGLALTMFSGNWTTLGFPGFPFVPDRIILVAAALALILKSPGAAELPRVRVRAVHLLMLITVLYALASAVLANTIGTKTTVFDLLDRLGAIPFLMFLLAPVIFSGPRERGWLLATLVGIGAYVGFTAVFESLGPHALVFPHYIRAIDTARESTQATGPFSQVVTEGFASFACAVAAVIASLRWRGLWKWVAIVVVIVCLFGSFLTFERGVWIGAVAGALAAGILARELRRWVLPAIPIGVLAVVGVLMLVPSLHSTATTRLNSIYPVWDRQNQTAAALKMVQAKPLFGFGWDNWAHTAAPYFRLAPNRLLTGYPSSLAQAQLGGAGSATAGGAPATSSPGLGQVEGALHDSYLSYAVELGLVGASLWLASVLWGLGGAVFNRDRDPDLRAWRLGLIAVGVCFLVLCAIDPLSQGFTSLVLWTWAGVAAGGAGWVLPGARRVPTRAAPARPTVALSRT